MHKEQYPACSKRSTHWYRKKAWDLPGPLVTEEKMKALAGGYIAGLRTRRLVRACVFDSCAYRGSENSHPLSPKNLTPPPSGVKISYYFMDILSDLSHGFTHSTEFLCMCFWILALSFGIY